MKRLLGVMGTSIALVLATSVSATAAGGDALSIIKAKTGKDAVRVTQAQRVGQVSVGVGHDKSGKALPSFAQSTGTTGVSMMATISDTSQSSVNYSLSLPVGAGLIPQPDGSLAISREIVGPNPTAGVSTTEQFGTIAAPWASDANGTSLPTSYTYTHGVLTQKVNTTRATFPVVADPFVTWGWFIYINFSRSETKRVAQSASYGQVAVTVCGLAVPVVAVSCGIFYGWVAVNMYSVFYKAMTTYNTCATVELSYALIYNGTVIRRC